MNEWIHETALNYKWKSIHQRIGVWEKKRQKRRIQPAFFLQNISTFSQGFCTWTLRASAPLYKMQNVLGWRFQISDQKQISQNAEMIISTCALFVEHAYKMISLYLPKPSCNIPFFSLGPYEFFGRIITASYFITSDTKEICNTNEDYSSYEFFPLSSRAQGIFNTGIRSGKILYLCERWVESTQMRSPLMTIGNTKATMLGWIIE